MSEQPYSDRLQEPHVLVIETQVSLVLVGLGRYAANHDLNVKCTDPYQGPATCICLYLKQGTIGQLSKGFDRFDDK